MYALDLIGFGLSEKVCGRIIWLWYLLGRDVIKLGHQGIMLASLTLLGCNY